MSTLKSIIGSKHSLYVPRYVVDSIVLVVFVVLFAYQRPSSILGCYLVSALYIFFNQDLLSIKKSGVRLYLGFVSLCIPSVMSFNHGYTPYLYLILSPLLVLFASVYNSQSITTIELSLKYLFWILVTLTFIGVVANHDSVAPLEGLIEGTSTNGIPAYIIVVYIAFALASICSSWSVPVLPALATLVIAIIGLGRGSIIVSTLLVLFSLGFKLVTSKVGSLYKYFMVFFVTVIAIILMPFNFSELQLLFDEMILSSKFSDGVLDEHRGRMIADYLGKINGSSLILGADFAGTSIIERYGGNPHNSYIRAHSFYGIWGLVAIFLPLILVFVKKIKWTLKLTFLFLLMCALARAMSEPIFFPSALDFFYILYFFILFTHYRSL